MKKLEYLSIIDICRAQYLNEFQKIQIKYKSVLNNYNASKMRSVMYEHKELILKTVKKILSYFPDFIKYNNMVLLTGSLARNTNLLYSDIDINFIYDNKYRSKFLEIEDKISYMMAKVFGYRGRDQIHGITYYLPKISNIFEDEIKENSFTLHFNDGNINYKCRENSFDTMWNTFNSTRSIEDLTDYMIKNINTFENWTNCYEIILDNGYYEEFHQKIKKNEKKTINECDFEYQKSEIIKRLNYNPSFKQEIKIKDLKLLEKEQTLNTIYHFLMYVYKFAIKNGSPIDTFDIRKIQDDQIINQFGLNHTFFEYVYHYYNLIVKLQYILNLHNMDLSKHSLKTIKKADLNKYYNEIFKGVDILKELSIERKKIKSEIKKILRNIK